MVRILLLLVVFLASKTVSSQTTVIAKKTKDAIYIGADSRSTITYNAHYSGITKVDTGSMCKIWTNGRLSFAVIGSRADVSKRYAAHACTFQTSLFEAIEVYRGNYTTDLAYYLYNLKNIDSIAYAKWENEVQPYYNQIVFCGIQGDSLYQCQLTFSVSRTATGTITINSRVNTNDVLYGGYTELIEKVAANPSTWTKEEDIPDIIKQLIMIEAYVHPMEVGGPTDILKITKTGVKWIKRKSLCTEDDLRIHP